MPRGFAWLDTGTPASISAASNFISAIEERQGLKVACLEEIGLRMKFINEDQVWENIKNMPNSTYKSYLAQIVEEIIL